jgi:outer membrane lipoprotein-sorting protein
MNKFLRTSPTRHLLTVILGIVAVAAAGTTIAIAAAGTGPVPRREPLARAIHQGLGAPAPGGGYARIQFTNNLIGSAEIQGSDPLLTGGTGRLWWSGHHFRLEIQGDNGDAQVVVNGGSFWAYDPAFNTVYRGELPLAARGTAHRRAGAGAEAWPSVAQIQAELGRLARHMSLIGGATDVGGQPAYTVRISPKHNNSLLGQVELAWDALRRIPLQVALYARGNPSPILALSVTDVSFGPQSSSVFDISPPAGARVVTVTTTGGAVVRRSSTGKPSASISGVSALAGHLPFALRAPATLAGRSRSATRLLRFSDHPAALVTYGHGLGAIVVLEQAGTRTTIASAPSGGDQPGLSLPTVAINGTVGQQLQTAIGTVVRFSRAGVTYTVLGSVSPATADAAARGL